MDKKILLSVLIVALIGVVAATYQINNGEDILNPLASVETEESPVTEVLAAPQTTEQAQADAQAQQQAQQQAQAQAQQAQDQANAEAQQAEADANQTSEGSGAQTISSDNPLTITTSSSGNGGSTVTVVDPNTDNSPDGSDATELSISEIQSILQSQLDKSNLRIDTDNYKFIDGTYQVKAYHKETNEFEGTFYIRPEDKSWYFIDKYGDTVGPDAPTV